MFNYSKAKAFLNNFKEAMRDSLNTAPDIIVSNADANGVVTLPYEGGYNRQQKQVMNQEQEFPFGDFNRSPNSVEPAGSVLNGAYVPYAANKSPNSASNDPGQMIDGVWVTDNQLAAMLERRIALKREADAKKKEAIAAGFMPMRKINYDTNVPLREIDIPFNLSSM